MHNMSSIPILMEKGSNRYAGHP
uniref:Uncharacterized protein n=1 Tax=Rhizophora mucronata TaxID=61149 RepID=A0A2P2N1V9_RHIMU